MSNSGNPQQFPEFFEEKTFATFPQFFKDKFGLKPQILLIFYKTGKSRRVTGSISYFNNFYTKLFRFAKFDVFVLIFGLGAGAALL